MQTAPQWMSQGILSFGLDTSRFGWDTLLPHGGAGRYMPVSGKTDEQFHWLLTNSLGAWVGLADNMARGWDSLMAGDQVDAISKFAPNLVGDVVSGLAGFGEPTMTRDQVPYYTPSMYERILNMTGLKSGGQAEAQNDMTAVYNGLQRARIRKQSLLGEYLLAETPEEQREAMGRIGDWNLVNPEIPITNKTIKASSMSRQNKLTNAQRTGVPLSSNQPALTDRLLQGGE